MQSPIIREKGGISKCSSKTVNGRGFFPSRNLGADRRGFPSKITRMGVTMNRLGVVSLIILGVLTTGAGLGASARGSSASKDEIDAFNKRYVELHLKMDTA